MQESTDKMEIEPSREPVPDDSLTSILMKLRNAEEKLLTNEPDPFVELSLDSEEPVKKPEKKQKKERGKKWKKREESKEQTGEEGETDKKPKKKQENYTHFFSLPLHTSEFKEKATSVMESILSKLDDKMRPLFRRQNVDQIHITLSMLSLKDEGLKEKARAAFQAKEKEISELCKHPFNLSFEKLGVFWDRGRGKKKMPRVIFLELKQDENLERLNKLCHIIISEMLANGVIQQKDLKKMNLVCDKTTNLFSPSNYHVTLFRIKKRKYGGGHSDTDIRQVLKEFEDLEFGTFPIKRIDISTRFAFDLDKFYLPLSTISFKEDEEARIQVKKVQEEVGLNELTTI